MKRADQKAYDAGYADGLTGREPDPDGGASADDEFAYDRGYTAGRDDASGDVERDGSRSARSDGSARAGRNGSRSSTKRPTSSRRKKSPAKKAAAAVARPVTRQVGSAVSVLGTAIVIALLYNLLTHTKAATGAFGVLAGIVGWLDDPDASIPYRS